MELNGGDKLIVSNFSVTNCEMNLQMHTFSPSLVGRSNIWKREEMACFEQKTYFPYGHSENGWGKIERGIYIARAGWKDGGDFSGGMRMMGWGGECASKSKRTEWRGETQNRICKCFLLFKGSDYCMLVVSSNCGLIDRKYQGGIRFSSCVLLCYRFNEHGTYNSVNEWSGKYCKVFCW